MRVRTVRPMPTQFLGFVLMLFSSKITGIPKTHNKLMFPCQSFGNVNNIICAMINFFENVYISLCYFLRLFVTLKSDLDREPKIVLWF